MPKVINTYRKKSSPRPYPKRLGKKKQCKECKDPNVGDAVKISDNGETLEETAT